MRHRIDWMEVGREIVPDDVTREFFLDAVKLIDKGKTSHGFDMWHGRGVKVPFCQGHAIKEAIVGYQMRNVTQLCYSNNWMDGSLFGIRATYQTKEGKQHSVDLFAINRAEGLITPVCARVWEGVVS